jgi:hypothetical protein
MKIAYAALLALALGCHKETKVAGGGSTEGTGSAGAVGSAGASEPGKPSGSGSAGTTGTAGSANGSPELVAAIDELDQWLAPALKLDTHPRIVALAKMQPTLVDKTDKLKTMKPPAGVAADAWGGAVDNFKAQIDGVGLCTQDLAKYDKMSKAAQTAADDGYEECTQKISETLAVVAKLVPGAKPPGTHANDPVMTPPAK